MARIAVEHIASEAVTPITSYDSTKWNLGTLIKKVSSASPVYIGPITPTVFRPFESAAAMPGIYPWVVQWSPTIDWIFIADNATAVATRRIMLATYDRSTPNAAPQYAGFITITFPSATAFTIRGFRMTYDVYTTGTAATNGTAVTGNGTAWQASRLSAGARIGFGSTDPTAISTWYEISAIGSDTGITLTSSAGVIGDGPYVIEELRCVIAATNATTTNGGLFVVKGLHRTVFAAGGTAIAAAIATDNVRACFWLADAASVTNIYAAGVPLKDRESWTTHYAYVLDSNANTSLKIYKYNLRAALTVASGKSTSAWVLTTGAATTTGNCSISNNGRMGTLNHGVGNGILSIYLLSISRLYRAAESGILSASTTFLNDAAVEIPPGGVNTFAATGAMACVELASTIDRLVITTTGATAFRSYITQYRTDASQWDHIILGDDKQLDQSAADAGIYPHATTNSVTQTPWSEGGLLYLASVGATAATNFLRVLPCGADWQYSATTSQYAISPKFLTPSCLKFNSMYCIRDGLLGSINLGSTTEALRYYYRTSGIDDNTGSWTVIPEGNDISGAAAASAIQFKIDFRCMSDTCLPGRIFRVGVTYDDISTDSHYQTSAGLTDRINKKFAWRFATAFGTPVPTLRVILYDAVTSGVLVDDNTSTPAGTFERSTNGGGAWVAWTNTDRVNDSDYIRYTPASLGDNIKVRQLLALY